MVRVFSCSNPMAAAEPLRVCAARNIIVGVGEERRPVAAHPPHPESEVTGAEAE
jgi:hypothetical protein